MTHRKIPTEEWNAMARKVVGPSAAEAVSMAAESRMFSSLYRCSDEMRCAPYPEGHPERKTSEGIFRAMLITWAAENGFEPDLDRLSHDDRTLYERLVAK